MPGDESQERFAVFPLALTHYASQERLDKAEAEADALAEILRSHGGGVRPWGRAVDRRDHGAVLDRLDDWASTPGNAMLVWIGHGRGRGTGPVLLAPRNATTDHEIEPKDLVKPIIDLHKRRDRRHWTAVAIEACGAGGFVDEMWRLLIEHRATDGVMLIGAGTDGGDAHLGGLRRVLEEVYADWEAAAQTMNDTDVSLSGFAGRFKELLTRDQRARCGMVRGVEPFLRLPRLLPPITAPVDVFAVLRRTVAELAEPEDREYFAPRGLAVPAGEVGCDFAGRQGELAAIREWLSGPAAGMFVVTGPAGCGKSALLGQVLLRARPPIWDLLVRAGFVPADDIGQIDVHAALPLVGAGLTEIVDRVAEHVGVELPGAATAAAHSSAYLLEQLRDRADPRTFLLDGLDEAVDPPAMAAFLRELAGTGGARLLVGTRPTARGAHHNLLDALGRSREDVIVHELSRSRDAVAAYVRTRLSRDPAFTRERGLGADSDAAAIATAVATSGAASAGGDFLRARLIVQEILSDPAMRLDGDRFTALINEDHESLFAAAHARITEQCPAVEAYLRALRLGHGPGLPRAGRIWQTAALALDGSLRGGDAELDEVLRHAGPYIMLDYDLGQSVYRPAHETFRSHIQNLSAATTDADTAAVAGALLDLADAEPGPLNPYLASYLPRHMVELGMPGWQALDARPGVLDRLDPRQLAAEVRAVSGGLSGLPAGVLGAVMTTHLAVTATPADRPGLRQLGTALITGGAALPAEDGLRWTVEGARLVPQPPHLTLRGHRRAVRCLARVPAPDGRVLLASGDDGGTVRLWDPASGWPMRADRVLDGPVLGLACVSSPGGAPMLVTAAGFGDEPLRVHDALGGALTAEGPARGGRMLLTVPTGRGDMVAAVEHGVRLLNPLPPTDRRDEPLAGHYGAITAVATWSGADDRTLLATAGEDGTIRLWDPILGRPTGPTLTDPGYGPIRALAALPRTAAGDLLISGHDDGRVVLWDPARGVSLPGGLLHGRPVRAVALLPASGERLLVAYADADARLRVRDLGPDGGLLLDTDTGQRAVYRVLPVGDGLAARLATAGEDGTIKLWEVAPGAAVGAGPRTVRPSSGGGARRTWSGVCRGRPWAISAGTACGLTVATGADSTILAWPDRVSAACLFTVPGGGRRLAAAGRASVIHLDDPVGGGRTALRGHEAEVVALVSVPTAAGPLLVSGDEDGELRIWDPARARLLHRIPLGQRLRGLRRGDGGRVHVRLAAGTLVVRLDLAAFTGELQDGGANDRDR